MKQFLKEVEEDGLLYRQRFLDMRRRNQGVEFDTDIMMLTELPSNVLIDDVIFDVSSKVNPIGMKVDIDLEDVFALNQTLINKVDGLINSIEGYQPIFTRMEIEKFTLVKFDGVEVVTLADTDLHRLLMEEEVILNRVGNKNEASRLIESLKGSDLSLFGHLVGEELTVQELMRHMSNGIIMSQLQKLRDDLAVEIVASEKSINLGKMDDMINNHVVDYVRLLGLIII